MEGEQKSSLSCLRENRVLWYGVAGILSLCPGFPFGSCFCRELQILALKPLPGKKALARTLSGFGVYRAGVTLAAQVQGFSFGFSPRVPISQTEVWRLRDPPQASGSLRVLPKISACGCHTPPAKQYLRLQGVGVLEASALNNRN